MDFQVKFDINDKSSCAHIMLINKRIPIPYILGKIKFEVYFVLLIGLIYYLTSEFGAFIPEMPIAIPSFIGTAISVILSLKLNQSYDFQQPANRYCMTTIARTIEINLRQLLDEDPIPQPLQPEKFYSL